MRSAHHRLVLAVLLVLAVAGISGHAAPVATDRPVPDPSGELAFEMRASGDTAAVLLANAGRRWSNGGEPRRPVLVELAILSVLAALHVHPVARRLVSGGTRPLPVLARRPSGPSRAPPIGALTP
jgi:hypothetical protein